MFTVYLMQPDLFTDIIYRDSTNVFNILMRTLVFIFVLYLIYLKKILMSVLYWAVSGKSCMLLVLESFTSALLFMEGRKPLISKKTLK